MIISRTPFRLSFLGGGTDYPSWSREHGGAVLSTTIDKYCYLTCRYLPPFFEHRVRVVYSKIELCQTIEEIRHPAVREALRFLDVREGVEIHHDGDLPARSGMGSSSSFMVGLLHALNALLGRMPTRRQLAEDSIHVEQEMIHETVGAQDQVAAAYGGFNRILFREDGDFVVQPVSIPRKRIESLNAHLLLLYSGIKRTASDVAASYVNSLDAHAAALHALRQLVDEAVSVLCSDQDLGAFGELMHEGWRLKRSLGSAVTNDAVDELYEVARRKGAIGGKVCGAGGGGFLLLFAPPERHGELCQAFDGLLQVPFRMESTGSQVIFYDPETDYSVEAQTRARQSLHAFREWGEVQPAWPSEGDCE